jgi:hypothetical protein
MKKYSGVLPDQPDALLQTLGLYHSYPGSLKEAATSLGTSERALGENVRLILDLAWQYFDEALPCSTRLPVI